MLQPIFCPGFNFNGQNPVTAEGMICCAYIVLIDICRIYLFCVLWTIVSLRRGGAWFWSDRCRRSSTVVIVLWWEECHGCSSAACVVSALKYPSRHGTIYSAAFAAVGWRHRFSRIRVQSRVPWHYLDAPQNLREHRDQELTRVRWRLYICVCLRVRYIEILIDRERDRDRYREKEIQRFSHRSRYYIYDHHSRHYSSLFVNKVT